MSSLEKRLYTCSAHFLIGLFGFFVIKLNHSLIVKGFEPEGCSSDRACLQPLPFFPWQQVSTPIYSGDSSKMMTVKAQLLE